MVYDPKRKNELINLFFFLTLCNLQLPLLECFVFGALISAVDPVAVLAIFQVSQLRVFASNKLSERETIGMEN